MANPDLSWEIRWFFNGPMPAAEVKEWFLNNFRFGNALTDADGEEREDLYLIAPQNTQLSPKLRGGKLEIKYLENQQEILGPDESVIGKGEVWKKWSWRYAKEFDEQVLAGFLKEKPEELRANVWKKRWQRKFKVTNAGELLAVPLSNKDLLFGIQAEITELKVKGTPWWTIAVEVFGAPMKPMSTLQHSLSWILRDYAGPYLQVDNSYSYPDWLSKL